jgi:RND family efflux transporter, MFP subunit
MGLNRGKTLLALTCLAYMIFAGSFYGCSSKNTKESTEKSTESHEGHNHSAGEAAGGHEGHNHTEGETARSHEGHNHSEGETARSHEGHNHSEGEAAGSHEGHNHSEGEAAGSHEGHNHSEGEAAGSHDVHDHSKGETKDAHANEAEKANSDEIVFTPEQAKAVGLETETVKPGPFSQVIKTSGQVVSSQGDEMTIVATVAGRINFSNGQISEGFAVGKGKDIATISSEGIVEGDQSLKAKALYEQAKSEFDRAEALVKDNIISKKEFEQIKLDYENAKIAYEGISKNITSKGVKVLSPINGFIKSRMVNQGEYVSVGQPIAVVSQNKKLQLRADVSDKYFASLNTIKGANFKAPYSDNIYKLAEMNGKLVSFGKGTNGSGFYLPVIFEFDNVGDVVPGSFVEVYLLSSQKENVISVPVSSLEEEQGLYFVFIRLDEECYKKQEVTLGANDGNRVEILRGLSSGKEVVTKGVKQVKLAASSSVIPEGHSHSH